MEEHCWAVEVKENSRKVLWMFLFFFFLCFFQFRCFGIKFLAVLVRSELYTGGGEEAASSLLVPPLLFTLLNYVQCSFIEKDDCFPPNFARKQPH